jgi:Fe-S-cluster containining protein
MSKVVRAVESGATTIRSVIDATGLSRLKVERALQSLEKQKLLVRDSEGLRTPGRPAVPRGRQCGSCNSCCDVLEVTAVAKPVNELCRHWAAGEGCTIYDDRPQMCRSFSCAWLQGHLGDEWYPQTAGMVVTSAKTQSMCRSIPVVLIDGKRSHTSASCANGRSTVSG